MAEWKLRSLKSGTLRERVKHAVREAIFQGRFRPGDPLRELDLARDLRVSQSTVREALLQLEQTGLVLRVPNRETVVTRLSQQDLRDRVSLRILLEGEAAVAAARAMGPVDFEELESRRANLAKAISRNAYFEVSQADLQFHRLFWEKSGNRTLPQLLENLTAPLFAFISILRSSEKHELSGSVLAHEPIIEAMKKGDPDSIRTAIRVHIETSYNEFLKDEWQDFESLLLSRKVVPRRRA
jgi:DNA-binding GntR family transcriptional regulator